jgi:MFS family permease
MSQRIQKPFLIITLWIAGLFAGAQFAKVSVLLPEFQGLYPAHRDQIAWLLTLVSIVGAIFGGIAGGLANRIGPRRLLTASLLAAGVLSLWQSTYPPFVTMAALRVAEGVTHLGIVVTAPALMAQISTPAWRGATMALWSTFFGVSFAVMAWFGIPHLDVLQVSGVFQLHGAGLIVIAGVLFLGLRGPAGEAPAQDTAASGKTAVFAAYGEIRTLWPGIGWLFYTLTFLALLTILPSLMQSDLRSQATTVMSLTGIATGLLIVPALLLRLRATTVVLTGFFFAALIAAAGSESSLFVLGILLFSVLGMVQGGTFAAVAELNQSTDKRMLGYGFMAQSGNLGNLIGTPFFLLVLNSYGSGALLLTTAAIYGVGVLCLIALLRRMPGTGA